MTPQVQRILVLAPGPWQPAGGICPVCAIPMDDGGCRIGTQHGVTVPPGHPFRRHKRWAAGVGYMVEVFCAGTPQVPVLPCPNCERIEREASYGH